MNLTWTWISPEHWKQFNNLSLIHLFFIAIGFLNIYFCFYPFVSMRMKESYVSHFWFIWKFSLLSSFELILLGHRCTVTGNPWEVEGSVNLGGSLFSCSIAFLWSTFFNLITPPPRPPPLPPPVCIYMYVLCSFKLSSYHKQEFWLKKVLHIFILF